MDLCVTMNWPYDLEVVSPNNSLYLGKVKVKAAQSCLTLCKPMDYTIHGILQARILEWVAFPFSRGSSQPRDRIRFRGRNTSSSFLDLQPVLYGKKHKAESTELGGKI